MESTYGDTPTSRYTTANAYMLTYRHVDPSRNMMTVEDVPEYVKQAMIAVETKEKEDNDPDNIILKVIYCWILQFFHMMFCYEWSWLWVRVMLFWSMLCSIDVM